MKLRCLIVDDEPLAHDVILRYLEDIPFLEKAGQCYLATEAFAFLNYHAVDLIFLDIRMPKLSGLDFLRTLDQRPLVVITSAYEEHALESFELEVVDYLLKTVSLRPVPESRESCIGAAYPAQTSDNRAPTACCAARSGATVYQIR